MAQAVIMAGGQGERFWPMTHPKFPKYRIRFDGKNSLLQDTFRRLAKVFGKANVWVVTTREHAALIREELPALGRKRLLIEPVRNNTAAAIYFSTAAIARERGEGEVVAFFPADHLIRNEALFGATLNGALRFAAKRDTLITVGIKPAFPATGYGYIEAGRPAGAPSAFRVTRFVEKPGRKKAESYLKKKNFYWNAGIFVWRAGAFLGAMKRFAPEFPRHFDLRKLASSYRRLPNLSIDYALMEKADDITVFKTSMDWCDMGNWDMLWEKSPRDAAAAILQGAKALECRHSLVVNQTDRPLVAVGLKDMIVVQTDRGTLVCGRGRAEEAALFFKKSR
ncbi:MAG TPA: sugar phosphate nucleotidyltransferase [Candidatus Eisenbacteria bacterium]|nr:sugar phosphate nucleotidyltransferase [Candidatus Eisenbacteria bacterium]